MAECSVRDRDGRFEISVSVRDTEFEGVFNHEDADAVLRSAVIMALAVLKQSERWPNEALRSMSDFMTAMRENLLH